jgi:filamentous hemagglutinin family protein
MAGRTHRARLAAAALAALAAVWATGAAAQPAGATVIFGNAQFQQLGRSLLVTTSNGAGTQHSVIDWRSFSVPAGSITHFLQPGADSTSINRVTGNKPSDIFGTLSSNGRLVLVNPSGIAVGQGAVIDTAGFTASALGMSDADAIAGRLRFSNDRGKAGVDIRGNVLARSGDVVLLGTEVTTDKDAIVSAPNGSVILAAGQRIALTGRGLEGIVLEVSSPSDRVVNLGRLQGDAVGMFASQLTHTGVIQANHVILRADKVRLERGGDQENEKEREKDNGKDQGDDNGAGGRSNGGGDLEELLRGEIDTSSSRSSGNSGKGGSGRKSGSGFNPPPPSPVIAAMESRSTQEILHGPQEVATLKSPAISKDPAIPGKRRADPALQCTP